MLAAGPDGVRALRDGNKDGVVDEQDVRNWSSFQHAGSSWYDFPARGTDGIAVYDGVTDEKDREVISDGLGKRCPRK